VGLRTSNLGNGVGVGGRGGTIRKSVGEFLIPIGPHSNFYSIFTRFRDIAAFVLRNATFLYPTSSLPKISPYVPLGVGGSPFRYKQRRRWPVGLIVRAISFQDFQP